MRKSNSPTTIHISLSMSPTAIHSPLRWHTWSFLIHSTPITFTPHHSTLTHLAFGKYFNQPIESLPLSLTHLEFGSEFNKEIKDLPPHLTHLTLSEDFNFPLQCIPPNLCYLKFGSFFNHPVGEILHGHSHLTYLIFGYHFDQPLGDHLPSTLTHLILGHYFNQPLGDQLPSSLIHLFIGYQYTHLFFIPPNLQYLHLAENFNHPIDHFPKTLSHLIVKSNIQLSIPATISHLELYSKPYDDLSTFPHLTHLSINYSVALDHYPPNITHFVFANIDVRITSLPPSITHLFCFSTISCELPPNLVYFKAQKITTRLPSTLKYLRYLQYKDQNIKHLFNLTHFSILCTTSKVYNLTLPPFITHLSLIGPFNDIIKSIPSTITHIFFGNNFNQSLEFLSPTNVQHIRFGRDFRQSLDPLPDSVIFLDILLCRKVALDKLPKSLKYLSLDITDSHKSVPPQVRIVSTRLGFSALMPSMESFSPQSIPSPSYCPTIGNE